MNNQIKTKHTHKATEQQQQQHIEVVYIYMCTVNAFIILPTYGDMIYIYTVVVYCNVTYTLYIIDSHFIFTMHIHLYVTLENHTIN